MEEYSDDCTNSNGEPYISCIKINGIPILPPLMTLECRQEMLYYKRLAIAVERRLNDLKQLCLDETTINSVIPSDSEDWCDSIDTSKRYQDKKSSSRQLFSNSKLEPAENNEFESINSLITVIDTEHEEQPINNSCVDDKLTSKDCLKNGEMDSAESVTRELDLIDLSNDSVNSTEKISNLSGSKSQMVFSLLDDISNCSTNDKSDYSSSIQEKPMFKKSKSNRSTPNTTKHTASRSSPKISNTKSSEKENRSKCSPSIQIKKIHNNSPLRASQSVVNKKSDLKRAVNRLSPSKNVTGSLNNISTGFESPSKMVRQNSYTLENPSPLLLAHLEERSLASGVDLRSISMSESTTTSYLCNSSKQRSWDSNTAKETWSSVSSDINSLSINECHDFNAAHRESFDLRKQTVSQSSILLDRKQTEDSSSDKDYGRFYSTSKNQIVPECNSELSMSEMSSNLSSPNKNLNNSINLYNGLNKSNPSECETLNKYFDANLSSDFSLDDKKEPINQSLTDPKMSKNVSDIDIVLKKMQDDHEKRLADLIIKQKREQLLLKQAFDEQQKVLFAQYENTSKLERSNSSKITSTKHNSNNSTQVDVHHKSSDSFNNLLNVSHSSCGKNENVHKEPKINGVPEIKNVSTNGYLKPDQINDFLPSADLQTINQNEDPPMTDRTSNTLDDVNSTLFTTDDIISEIENNLSLTSNNLRKEFADLSPVKSGAFEKITKIKEKLDSPSNYRNLPQYFFESQNGGHAEDSVQSISLSSINQDGSPLTKSKSSANRDLLSLDLLDIHRPNYSRSYDSEVFFSKKYDEKQIRAATTIVAYAKGYLTRRLMQTEKVQSTVQTIRDTLLCALQLHGDKRGIRGADVDLHRRLIQQITAACYALHDVFIIYTPAEKMSIISQDRERRKSLSHRSSSSSTKQLSSTTQKVLKRKIERMSKSHSGVFNRPPKTSNLISPSMTRSQYESNCNNAKADLKPRRSLAVSGDFVCRKPWR